MRMEVQREISRVTPRLAALSRAEGLRAAPMARICAARGSPGPLAGESRVPGGCSPNVSRRHEAARLKQARRPDTAPPPRRRFLGFLTNIAFRPDV